MPSMAFKVAVGSPPGSAPNSTIAAICGPASLMVPMLTISEATVISTAQTPTVFRCSRTRRKPDSAASVAENCCMALPLVAS